ncbi:hypothetical protein VNO77_16709 [Canavalia gladiata]|uniref:Histidine-containing phosphotransfer protein n=1 Tax=Canavalia gladiata TaxID=3824 RepID=A0AAN9LIA7_CANGL
MEVTQLKQKHRHGDHQNAMIREGYLDDQFIKLQKLQDESSPYFVTEILTIYFSDAKKILNDMAQALEKIPADFKTVERHVYQLKGSSASIGAARVKIVCVIFRSLCEARNLDGYSKKSGLLVAQLTQWNRLQRHDCHIVERRTKLRNRSF